MADNAGGGFAEFCKEVCTLADGFEGMALRVESDDGCESVRVTGGGFAPLARARAGLADVAELSAATAEHHPYWEILSRCCQICDVVLDGWDATLGREEADEMRWAVGRLEEACKRIAAGDARGTDCGAGGTPPD